MKRLLWISLFVCVYLLDAEAKPKMERDTVPQFFDALIEVAGQRISGIMIVKHEENQCRILFTSLAGPKLLDMYVSDTDYRVLYAVKKLKKRLILRLFQKDFALITGLYLNRADKNCEENVCSIRISKKELARYVFNSENEINKAEFVGKNKTLFEVKYGYENHRLDSICLQHFNFKMKITLSGRAD